MKNPISENWYADPESRVYNGTVYMYVTNSLPFEDQKNLDLVTTDDLKTFQTYRNILDMDTYKGAVSAIWAPTVIDQNGKYYIIFIFAANNIADESEIGGLYLGVSEDPKGPFANVFADGRPLINAIYGGAQPIDAHLFKDDDGQIYLYYGGWGHLMVCRMNDTMDGFLPMEEPCFDGIAKEITPHEYVEAPCVIKINGKYSLMYSTGAWTNDTYRVKAAESDSPLGNFEYYADVLKAEVIADGPGHNGAFYFNGQYYTAYHRRTPGDDNPHHRRLCIDKIEFEGSRIKPIKMT